MVSLLGVVIIFCLSGVVGTGFMAVLKKLASAEVVVDFWRLISDVGNRRMMF